MFIKFINLFFLPFGYQWVLSKPDSVEDDFDSDSDQEAWNALYDQNPVYKLVKQSRNKESDE